MHGNMCNAIPIMCNATGGAQPPVGFGFCVGGVCLKLLIDPA